MGGVLVFSEDREIARQLLGKAVELSGKLGGRVSALAIGIGEEDLIKHGADIVYIFSSPLSYAVEPYRTLLLEAVERESPDVILVGGTKRGKELAPRVAAALGAGYASDCLELGVDDTGRLLAKRLAYGGSSIASETWRGRPAVATAPARAFQKLEPSDRKGEVVKLDIVLPESKLRVIESRPKKISDAGLENASIIVSAGRGFKKRYDLQLLEELAGVLGARMGCTRPIAADLGWMDQWVGISGKKVSPRLYVACGVSGTIQHAAGIRGSQLIVSINNDEAAGIHELSDYSVIGDIYMVLPALTKLLRENKRS
jgi:electron transfer flavoprotein alpha subunit